jgi:predicted lipoprotein with Yx(FWY)xxD motif
MGEPMKASFTPLAAGAALALALLAAGCGGSSTASAGSSGTAGGSTASSSGGLYGRPPATTTTTTASGPATVAVRRTSLGGVLVDGSGMTLYLFEKDTGPKSTCNGACAAAWPPLTTNGAPKAETGVAAAKLGTTKRADGTMQVTYNGHPLYGYVVDQNPGDTTGQAIDAFGAEWYVLSPKGDAIVSPS